MRESPPKVITIPAKPEVASRQAVQRQLRVAAYCRVSTDDEEQLTSYEAQQNYYTDKIMTNREWTMAGIFADEGITGTSARKRPEFLKMIRLCKQKKIDIVLTKSISRFARNTVDCLNYIRALRELGIAVIFEKENINTLEADSEILITMLGAFAQAESESISANVRWGKRQAMREGKTIIQYNRLYAYEKGEDGKPKIIQEQAEVVRSIYDQYLSGASLRMIKDRLEAEQIPNVTGGSQWTITAIRSILTNEKYCGDVLRNHQLRGRRRIRRGCCNRSFLLLPRPDPGSVGQPDACQQAQREHQRQGQPLQGCPVAPPCPRRPPSGAHRRHSLLLVHVGFSLSFVNDVRSFIVSCWQANIHRIPSHPPPRSEILSDAADS